MGMMWDTALGQRTIGAIGEACAKASGVTLHDVFAMSALNGLIGSGDYGEGDLAELSPMAYRLADVMLEARKINLKKGD